MSQQDYLIVRVGDYRFGLATRDVQDVFHPAAATPVPHAPPEYVGLLNLRGRIVTAVCARIKLGLPPLPSDAAPAKAVCTDIEGDLFGLIIDEAIEVISLDEDTILSPSQLAPRWAGLVTGIVRTSDGLVLISRPECFVASHIRPAPSAATPAERVA